MECCDLGTFLDAMVCGTDLHISVVFTGRPGSEIMQRPYHHVVHKKPVCSAMRKLPDGNSSCVRCRMAVQKYVSRHGKPLAGYCQKGVFEYCAPVIWRGETVAVVITMPDPADGKIKKLSLHLLVEQYAELGVQTGEIISEKAEAILDAGRLCGAIRRGMAMLGYGDQSARRLAYKLTAKGVDRDTTNRAVAYLTERGYIREESTAALRARQGVSKGWGERRIREDLCAHGFTREAVEEAMEELSDTDWVENCASAIRKKYGEIPEDKGERQKLIAAMMRLGYDADTVKEAVRDILRES